MMRAAVIDKSGAVVNVIVADPEKDSIPGHTLVAVPDGVAVDTRWVWSEAGGVWANAGGFMPGPELQAEIDARAAAVEAEGLSFND